MTYSRPGIGRVNVRASASGGSNVPTISLPTSGPKVTANAPYREYLNPQQAAKNVDVKYQGINALLEFANSDVVKKFAIDRIDANAKREAGKALDAYPALSTTSQNNPAADAAYNALSPRAQDFVVEARAANAVSTYGPALEAQLAKETILSSASATPEQVAEATARATSAARDAAGFSALPPYQLVVNSEKLAQIDGQFKGATYQARVIKQSDIAQVGLIEGATAGLTESFQTLSQVGADDSAGDEPLTTGFRASIQEIVTTTANNYGPQGQATVVSAAIGRAFNNLTDPQDQLEFLQRVQAVAQEGMVGADGTTDIFTLNLPGTNKTIKQVLAEKLPGAEQAADKGIVGKAYLEALRLMEGNDPNRMRQARDLMLSQAELLNNPAMIPTFINQLNGLTTRVSHEMKQAGFAVFERQLGGEDATALYKEMIGAPVGTYDPRDIEKMYGIARQGGTNQDYNRKRESFNNARADAKGIYEAGWTDYLNNTDLGDSAYGPDKQGKNRITAAGERAKFNYMSEVRSRYFAKMDAAEPGKFDATKALNEAINEAVYDKGEEAKKRAGDTSTPKETYIGWADTSLNSLSQAASANGGRIESKSIPAAAINPSVLTAWQQQNPDKSFDSLSGLQKEKLLVRSIQTFKRYDAASGQYVNYTEQEATKRASAMLKEAERKAANNPAPATQRVPETVPVKPPADGEKQYVSPAQKAATELLERSVDYIKQDGAKDSGIPAYEGIKQWYNNGGFGPQAMSFVDGFLNMTLGAAPANAGQLDFGTPEGLEALRTSWSSGQQGLNTGPLPQVAAATPVRYAPVAITSDKHELFVMVGVAEGTRTPSGGYTKAYYGHRDSGDGNWNRGTVSGGRNTSASPQMVDRKWMGTLTNVQQRMRGALIVHGLEPGTAGYNRVMFNLMDLTVQSPAAARDFAGKLIVMKNANWTVEAIAKARTDSYINPETGRLDAPGFGNNYQRLFKDQRSRAGVYDYRRRI